MGMYAPLVTGRGYLDVVSIEIGSLTPYPENPRKNRNAIAKVADSIREYGFRQPIVVDEANVILAGHTRLEAAKRLKLKQVPVHVAKGLTEAQAKAYRLMDNRSAEDASWDMELLSVEIGDLLTEGFDLALTGFTGDELNNLLLPDVDIDDDRPEKPIDDIDEICKDGDVWILGSHRLKCGDAINSADIDELMQGESVDCVFTSPPYAVGIDYGIYQDTIDSLREMLPKLSKSWIDIVRKGGYAVVNFADIVSAKSIVGSKNPCEYPMALEYWPIFRGDGWELWSRRIWCKPSAGTGSMQCISSNRAAKNWEHVWTWKAPGNPIHSKQTKGLAASQNGWIDSTNSHHLEVGLKTHGAGMPISTALFFVETHSHINNGVYEPFCGTGTTLIACERLNRRCFAMELNPRYCDIIIKRWENFTGEIAKREGN